MTDRDPFGWIGNMLRHDAGMDALEQAPTGDDYNAIFPAGLGFIWHTCDAAAEFLEHAKRITKHHGVIQTVHEYPDGHIHVVFAITHHDYAQMVGREPDADEWMTL